MASAVAPRAEPLSPSFTPAAIQQAGPATPPDPAPAKVYRPDWWGLQIWLAGALVLAGLHVFDALGRVWRWLF
jgi:hypothetical protein